MTKELNEKNVIDELSGFSRIAMHAEWVNSLTKEQRLAYQAAVNELFEDQYADNNV